MGPLKKLRLSAIHDASFLDCLLLDIYQHLQSINGCNEVDYGMRTCKVGLVLYLSFLQVYAVVLSLALASATSSRSSLHHFSLQWPHALHVGVAVPLPIWE